MSTLTIEYGIRSEIVSKLFEFFSKIAGAKVKREYTATEDEIERWKKSEESGAGSIDELKEFLRQ